MATTSSVPVRFLGTTTVLGKGVVLRAQGRYHVAGRGERPELVVVDPAGPVDTAQHRIEFPHSWLVLWDRRDDVEPASVEAALGAGADAYVVGRGIDVLLAHLDSLARRTLPRRTVR